MSNLKKIVSVIICMAICAAFFAGCAKTPSEQTPAGATSVPDEHVHNFNVRNTDEQYLKSAATSSTGAIYYYSCECGEKGTETFESGEPLKIWDGSVADGFESGSGTVNDPYIIRTPEQLAFLSFQVNEGNTTYRDVYFKLGNDIYLNDPENVENWMTEPPKNAWEAIGVHYNATVYYDKMTFSGTFDGDGHVIYGLYIDDDKTNMQGLFGSLMGTVKNLAIEKSVILAANVAGAICGENHYGRIINCYNSGYVSGNQSVGGICGYNEGTVLYCCNEGEINGDMDVGGIAGSTNAPGALVSNSYNAGNVRGSALAGGICGDLCDGSVDRCYSTGDVVATEVAGGVVGRCVRYSGYVSYCYYRAGSAKDGTETVCRGIGCETYWGETLGRNLDASEGASFTAGLTEAQMKAAASFEGFDFDEVWNIGTVEGYDYPSLNSLPVLAASKFGTSVSERVSAPANEQLFKYEDGYILFGSYPQSKVTDQSLTEALTDSAGTTDTWNSYQYYDLGSKSDYMVYTDIQYDGEKYRGVFFTRYRPREARQTASSESEYTNQRENGYLTNTVYWFKYEPVKWKIISESDEDVFIYSAFVLDAREFHHLDDTRVFFDYEQSHIRTWLNEDFYNTAFSDDEKNIINTTVVDNSGSLRFGSYTDVCDNTNDKLFLLSYGEISSGGFGYIDRMKDPTQYAKAQGASREGSWCLRSSRNSQIGYVLGKDGRVIDIDDRESLAGVVPALHLSLTN